MLDVLHTNSYYSVNTFGDTWNGVLSVKSLGRIGLKIISQCCRDVVTDLIFSFVLVYSYSSCCWISSLVLYADSSWLVSTKLDLTPRSDNGKINSSPVSRSPAIFRLHEGCKQSLRIPVEDPDGDVVKCRWASKIESNIPSDSFPHGVLDEVMILLSHLQTFHFYDGLLLCSSIYNTAKIPPRYRNI